MLFLGKLSQPHRKGRQVKSLLLFAALLLSANMLTALAAPIGTGNNSAPQAAAPRSSSLRSNRSGGPQYDVIEFGAIGNGAADDTAAIQAAFNACWANGTGVQPYGGVVEFPGNHSYLITKTINAYDSCRVEGNVGAMLGGGANSPPEIRWNGPFLGSTASLTGFVISLNVASITFTANPSVGDTVTVNGLVITFVSSRTAGDQVKIEASAAATATALFNFLNSSSNSRIKVSQPFTNPVPGVIDFKYQSIGLNGKVESVAASDPALIRVQAAFYPASSPAGGRAYPYKYVATIQAPNTYSTGDWVYISGLTSPAGVMLNRVVSEVMEASRESFTVFLAARTPNAGTYSDSGIVTSLSVDIATDSLARSEQDFKDIQIQGGAVGLFMGSRVDTGTHFQNIWLEKQSAFGYYFSVGGINVDFDKGWRIDSPGIAGIYWRNGSGDNFGIANGQTFSGSSSGHGASIMIDNQGCNGENSPTRFTLRNVAFEVVSPGLSPGLGAITLLDCTTTVFPTQFSIDMENTDMTSSVNATAIQMTPANDAALNLTIVNGMFGTSNTARWGGMPALTRYDQSGATGFIPSLVYAPSFQSNGSNSVDAAMSSQCLGDCNIGQLWQYGIQASALLYSDAAFAALPNATTLYAGQILAPPSYWSGANGKRFALDVVYRTGTTGTPNDGGTHCSGTKAKAILTCDSAADLSVGQRVTIGADRNKAIESIDATNLSEVRVSISGKLSTSYSAQVLSYSAPLLASEIQLPTKSSGAPTAQAWSQGDIEQNANAKTNGVAAWVNVIAGQPGAWAGIPLGNSSGQINSSQIAGTTGSGNVVLAEAPAVNSLSDTGTTSLNNVTIHGTCSGCGETNLRTGNAWCAGTAASSATIAMFGAGSATASCSSRVGAETVAQLLMTTNGNVSNLAVRCASSGLNASSGVFSVWDLPSGSAMSGADSGVNTGLTVTYGTTKANTTMFDPTHRFTYAKGDLLRIQFTTQEKDTLGNCEASFNY